jgi:23S rRNA (pseudouridine1915-N3)-methyltransferase
MVSKINIIAVGKIKEQNINKLIDEYSKRLGPYIKLSFKELKDEGIVKESSRILDVIEDNRSDGKGEDTFILDAKGKQFTSEEFSEFLKKRQEVIFIIGGPDGILDDVKTKAKLISISTMTFTHEMCRALLMEQIYRAVMIEKGRKYHK